MRNLTILFSVGWLCLGFAWRSVGENSAAMACAACSLICIVWSRLETLLAAREREVDRG